MIIVPDHFLPFPSSLKLCMVYLNTVFVAHLAQLLNIKLIKLRKVKDRLCPAEEKLGQETCFVEGVFVTEKLI